MAQKETGLQFLARLGPRPSLELLEPAVFLTGPQCTDVIELYGGEGTCKTELLLHLTTRCILPEKWNGIRLDGRDASVVYIDTDHKFSVMRLATLMERYIISKAKHSDDESRKLDPEQLESFICTCLKKLHVVHCVNSSQFLITLHTLETLLCNQPGISAIMIDSISAFYWMDRCSGGDSFSAQEANIRRATNILNKLVSTYNLVLFATKAALIKNKVLGGYSNTADNVDVNFNDLESEHSEFMCKPWQQLVTKRYVIVPVTSDSAQQQYSVGGDHLQGTRFTVSDAGIHFHI